MPLEELLDDFYVEGGGDEENVKLLHDIEGGNSIRGKYNSNVILDTSKGEYIEYLHYDDKAWHLDEFERK